MLKIVGQNLTTKDVLIPLNSSNVQSTFSQNGIGSEINQYVDVQSIANCSITIFNSKMIINLLTNNFKN